MDDAFGDTKAGATPSRPSAMASSGRERHIPACQRSRAPSPARPGVGRASLPCSEPARAESPSANRPPLPMTADVSAGLPTPAMVRDARQPCTLNPCINPKPRTPTMRPYWKGYLKLALVSCPIALHAACSTAERIAFRQINKATGNRLRQQLMDEETREPVAPEHKGRGYEVAKGQYLVVEDTELEAIEIESTHTIEIDTFLRRAQIDQRFFHSPDYVMPSAPVGQEAFAVIREAMRGKGMVALGRLVLAKRERVMALETDDKGLLG